MKRITARDKEKEQREIAAAAATTKNTMTMSAGSMWASGGCVGGAVRGTLALIDTRKWILLLL